MATTTPSDAEIQLRMEIQALKGRNAQLEADLTASNDKLQAQVTAHQLAIATLQGQVASQQATLQAHQAYLAGLATKAQAASTISTARGLNR